MSAPTTAIEAREAVVRRIRDGGLHEGGDLGTTLVSVARLAELLDTVDRNQQLAAEVLELRAHIGVAKAALDSAPVTQ